MKNYIKLKAVLFEVPLLYFMRLAVLYRVFRKTHELFCFCSLDMP